MVLETCCSFLNNFARCRRLKYCTLGTSQTIFAILTSTVSLTMFSSSACSLASFWANVSRRLRACENFCVTKSVLEAKLGQAKSAGICPTSSEARLAQLLSILEIYLSGD